jgi:hypothetical protein
LTARGRSTDQNEQRQIDGRLRTWDDVRLTATTWLPSAIDPELEPDPAILAGYAQLSPDGPYHFAVVHAKQARMSATEPTCAGPNDRAGRRVPAGQKSSGYDPRS